MKQVRHGNGDEKTRCAHVALRVALRERHAPLAHRRLPAFPGERAPVAFTWVWVGLLGSFTHGAPLFLKPRPSPRPKNLWICEIPSALFRSPTDTPKQTTFAGFRWGFHVPPLCFTHERRTAASKARRLSKSYHPRSETSIAPCDGHSPTGTSARSGAS